MLLQLSLDSGFEAQAEPKYDKVSDNKYCLASVSTE